MRLGLTGNDIINFEGELKISAELPQKCIKLFKNLDELFTAGRLVSDVP
jgi:hypothetical protein